ncbi:MAG: FecR domain-containing protein [Spirosomataceae bacterium]
MNVEISKEFIFSYLSGKTTALQKQMLDEWIKNPANEEQFYKWLVEYEYQHPQYMVRLQDAIDRFHAKADHYDANPDFILSADTPSLPVRRYLGRWLMAACFILGMLIGGWAFKDNLIYQTYTTTFGETKSLQLSDLTKITLNANSSLQVPRFGFGSSTREVFLNGEANFAVTHTPDHQRFVVKTEKGVEIIVLGTEFTVYSRRQSAKVVLNKGKVQLRYLEGKARKQVMMKPGDLVTLDPKNRLRQEVTSQPEKYAAWKDHRFVFEDTSLEEFSKIMEENYGVRVVIGDRTLAKRTLVGSFRAENADELLGIISEIFDINIVKTGDTVMLTDKQ